MCFLWKNSLQRHFNFPAQLSALNPVSLVLITCILMMLFPLSWLLGEGRNPPAVTTPAAGGSGADASVWSSLPGLGVAVGTPRRANAPGVHRHLHQGKCLYCENYWSRYHSGVREMELFHYKTTVNHGAGQGGNGGVAGVTASLAWAKLL